MEVAGLVLGGIPLAIYALQEYRSFLSTFRHAQRQLDSTIRHLQAQRNILANTCNVLLTGIATPSEIEAMILAPFSPAWNKHQGKVKLRLGEDFKIFQDTILEMLNTVKSLQRKLAIDDDGKVSTVKYNRCLGTSHIGRYISTSALALKISKYPALLLTLILVHSRLCGTTRHLSLR